MQSLPVTFNPAAVLLTCVLGSWPHEGFPAGGSGSRTGFAGVRKKGKCQEGGVLQREWAETRLVSGSKALGRHGVSDPSDCISGDFHLTDCRGRCSPSGRDPARRRPGHLGECGWLGNSRREWEGADSALGAAGTSTVPCPASAVLLSLILDFGALFLSSSKARHVKGQRCALRRAGQQLSALAEGEGGQHGAGQGTWSVSPAFISTSGPNSPPVCAVIQISLLPLTSVFLPNASLALLLWGEPAETPDLPPELACCLQVKAPASWCWWWVSDPAVVVRARVTTELAWVNTDTASSVLASVCSIPRLGAALYLLWHKAVVEL